MAENQKRILEMLAEKKISVEEAAKLLSLTQSSESSISGAPDSTREGKPMHKYLRIVVQPNPESGQGADYEHVNIRVPMTLIRAGIKLASLIPPQATEHVNEALRNKGIDMDLRNIKAENLEPLVDALSDLEVDVHNKREQVRIYFE